MKLSKYIAVLSICCLPGIALAAEVSSADVEALYQQVISDNHLTSVEGKARVWKPDNAFPGLECLNFANWAFNRLHGTMAGYRNGTSHNLQTVGSIKPVFRSPEKDKLGELELALTSGRIHPGDFIQWAKNSDGMGHHSAIFGEYDAAKKRIRILDSNRSSIWNQVRYDWLPMKTFLWRCDRGVAFYRKKG